MGSAKKAGRKISELYKILKDAKKKGKPPVKINKKGVLSAEEKRQEALRRALENK